MTSVKLAVREPLQGPSHYAPSLPLQEVRGRRTFGYQAPKCVPSLLAITRKHRISCTLCLVTMAAREQGSRKGKIAISERSSVKDENSATELKAVRKQMEYEVSLPCSRNKTDDA